MGFSSGKKKNPPKPNSVKEHKKAVAIRKILHNPSLPDKIPPVIQEAVNEDENSQNYQEQNREDASRATDNPIRIDKTRTDENTVESRTRNSYLSESVPSNQQNVNHFFMQNRVISRTNSVPNSIRSSGRNSSVQSMTVIREQYCCCSKWTRCERFLGLTVGIMAIIIVALLVVIGVLSSNRSRSNFEGLTLTS